jgi:hypothetical protein
MNEEGNKIQVQHYSICSNTLPSSNKYGNWLQCVQKDDEHYTTKTFHPYLC